MTRCGSVPSCLCRGQESRRSRADADGLPPPRIVHANSPQQTRHEVGRMPRAVEGAHNTRPTLAVRPQPRKRYAGIARSPTSVRVTCLTLRIGAGATAARPTVTQPSTRVSFPIISRSMAPPYALWSESVTARRARASLSCLIVVIQLSGVLDGMPARQ